MRVPTTPGLTNLATSAGEDLLRGLRQKDLWLRLGWLEIKRRYQRTVLGPFWASISLFTFVMALGTIGGSIFNKTAGDYLPFLVGGMVVWVMVSSIITESGTMFVGGSGLFRQTRFDYSILAYVLVWRNFIVFLHNLVVYALIILLFAPHLIRFEILLAIPGMVLVLINGVWIALLLGMICLRFRDVQQIVASLIQISMFVTPIFWTPDTLSGWRRVFFVGVNPLYHLINIVRDPLLGRLPTWNSYIAVSLITVFGWSLTFEMFRRFRRRIAYWS